MPRFLALLLILLLGTPAPIIARSLDFNDAAGGTVTYPITAISQIAGASGVTISFWVNMDNVIVRMWYLTDAANTVDVAIDNAVGGGGLRFDAGGTSSIAATPPLGAWANVAVSYDSLAAGAKTRFYINGVLQGPNILDGATGNIGTPSTSWVLGSAITSTLNGRMFNVKIFRQPMGPEGVNAEMLCYRPQADGLVFWAPLDMGDKTIPELVRGIPGVANAGISTSDSIPPVELCGAGG